MLDIKNNKKQILKRKILGICGIKCNMIVGMSNGKLTIVESSLLLNVTLSSLSNSLKTRQTRSSGRLLHKPHLATAGY